MKTIRQKTKKEMTAFNEEFDQINLIEHSIPKRPRKHVLHNLKRDNGTRSQILVAVGKAGVG